MQQRRFQSSCNQETTGLHDIEQYMYSTCTYACNWADAGWPALRSALGGAFWKPEAGMFLTLVSFLLACALWRGLSADPKTLLLKCVKLQLTSHTCISLTAFYSYTRSHYYYYCYYHYHNTTKCKIRRFFNQYSSLCVSHIVRYLCLHIYLIMYVIF